MTKAFKIQDFPNYYITDNGDIYSRYINNKHNQSGRFKKIKPCCNGIRKTAGGFQWKYQIG